MNEIGRKRNEIEIHTKEGFLVTADDYLAQVLTYDVLDNIIHVTVAPDGHTKVYRKHADKEGNRVEHEMFEYVPPNRGLSEEGEEDEVV